MTNFAVIETGAKQYKISVGDNLKIEKLKGDHKVGDKISFENVLLLINGEEIKLGAPYLTGAKVSAEIKNIAKHKTIEVIKYKAKTRYHKKNGHRQPYFEVSILAI